MYCYKTTEFTFLSKQNFGGYGVEVSFAVSSTFNPRRPFLWLLIWFRAQILIRRRDEVCLRTHKTSNNNSVVSKSWKTSHRSWETIITVVTNWCQTCERSCFFDFIITVSVVLKEKSRATAVHVIARLFLFLHFLHYKQRPWMCSWFTGYTVYCGELEKSH